MLEETSSIRFSSPSSGSPSGSHRAHSYESEEYLLDELSRFVGAAISAGDTAMVLATRAHLDEASSRLRGRGLDLSLPLGDGRFHCMHAEDAFAVLLEGGQIDSLRFDEVLGAPIARLVNSARKQNRKVAVFAELVSLLWAEGNREAAIRLDQLLNELLKDHPFELMCAYPFSQFQQKGKSDGPALICAEQSLPEYSRRVPSKIPRRVDDDDARGDTFAPVGQDSHAAHEDTNERSTIQQLHAAREAELKEFLEDAGVGIHWLSPDGTILWANRTELAILQYRPEEYIGHSIFEFHAEPNAAEEILARVERGERVSDYGARLRRKDGAIRDVRIDATPFRYSGGFAHTRCLLTDITEKAYIEQAAMRLAAIVESSDDAIVSKDLNGIITSWNESAQRMFGYEAHEIVGRPITTLIPLELHGDEPVILGKIRAGQRIEHFQTVRVRKDGTHIDVSLTVSPVKDGRGNIVGASKIVRDITRQKQLEAALHVSEKLASVGRLAATIAHEINNPLEAVTNFIYLAKHQPGIPEKTKRYLQTADQELARVAHIAQQTLGFYRDTSEPDLVMLHEVIEDVLTVYERKLRYKSIDVEKRIDPGLAFHALKGELKQILSNLITNAIEASQNRGKLVIAARRVSLPAVADPVSVSSEAGTLAGDRSAVRITVADQGTGISPESASKLFVPFFTTKKNIGTGLGLWITKDLINKRGGSIRFRSRTSTPSGTVMSFWLPFDYRIPESEIMVN